MWTKLNETTMNLSGKKNLLRFKNLFLSDHNSMEFTEASKYNNCLFGKSLLGKITFINILSHFGQYLETI